jgi:hypothetical protein
VGGLGIVVVVVGVFVFEGGSDDEGGVEAYA